MTFLSNRDFLIDVRLGKVPDTAVFQKYGYNASVPNGTFAFVTGVGQTEFTIQAPGVARVVSNNAQDGIAGTGARKVLLTGLDDLGQIAAEEVDLVASGTSLPTTETWWRVDRAIVTEVGTYGGANIGDLEVTVDGAAGNQDIIIAGANRAAAATWSTPTGLNARLLSVHGSVDGNQTASIRLYTRPSLTTVAAPMGPKILHKSWDGVSGEFSYKPRAPELAYAPLSDVWMEASGAAGGISVRAEFELIVFIDDGSGGSGISWLPD